MTTHCKHTTMFSEQVDAGKAWHGPGSLKSDTCAQQQMALLQEGVRPSRSLLHQ